MTLPAETEGLQEIGLCRFLGLAAKRVRNMGSRQQTVRPLKPGDSKQLLSPDRLSLPRTLLSEPEGSAAPSVSARPKCKTRLAPGVIWAWRNGRDPNPRRAPKP